MENSRWCSIEENNESDEFISVEDDNGSEESISELRSQYLFEGAEIPDMEVVKDFLRYHAALLRGRIVKQPTMESLNSEAERFFAGFTRVTKAEFDKDFRSEVYDVSVFPVSRALYKVKLIFDPDNISVGA